MSDIVEIATKSAEETQALAERLGRALLPGDVLAFVGELGAGKTTFIQGLARGLGLEHAAVRSPTFIVLREYPGRVPLVHIDGYRLEGAPAAVWLDIDWVFSPAKVTAIEWANRIEDVLPEDHLEIQLTHRSANQRAIRLLAHGRRSADIMRTLRSGATAA